MINVVKDSLTLLDEKIEEEKERPAELLRAIFHFIKFSPAEIDIYFLLVNNSEPMTVKNISRSVNYSERTVRKYLQLLLNKGYIKRKPVERVQPCFAYFALSPKVVWKKLVNEIRSIRIRATKSISKFKGAKRSH